MLSERGMSLIKVTKKWKRLSKKDREQENGKNRKEEKLNILRRRNCLLRKRKDLKRKGSLKCLQGEFGQVFKRPAMPFL
jgi:hypothetical protein